ncbi:hypothetical protein F442_01665 [Phytophthora nicotianae P10297]|uniref:RxLR effector protein n=1 Tax=Phytophthora nicotianae P10297 TaxID=1317064 RepID=W3A4I9_PHYNI|nr:hypothetical protein F442_01665 [Phytophthora nicotianae P10297]
MRKHVINTFLTCCILPIALVQQTPMTAHNAVDTFPRHSGVVLLRPSTVNCIR